jgi:hypothetical protein
MTSSIGRIPILFSVRKYLDREPSYAELLDEVARLVLV